MESGSLLPEALRYMERIRQNELHQLPIKLNAYKDNQSQRSNYHNITENIGEINECANTLVLSLYCIDDDVKICYDDNVDVERINEKRKKQKLIHQRLAFIHSIIHTKLLPCYQERYNHSWFTGGQGICFGLHCSDGHDKNNKKYTAAPHLRATINYGPHPIDEYYSLALILQLTQDLHNQYHISSAVSCWDVDDGQILLIEGADSIPCWVDDVVGVVGMNHRVYVVNGRIKLLDPLIRGKEEKLVSGNDDHEYQLTIKESLYSLYSKLDMDNEESKDESALNQTLQQRFHPFMQVISQSLDHTTKRRVLKDHIHTAVAVLPLQLALLIKQRPDLLSCAILQFCSTAPLNLDKKERKKSIDAQLKSYNSTDDEQFDIRFENLVFTIVTMTRSLYAMLLTAAGQVPPPIKIPKHFKSIELNRIKRQCLLGGDGYSHFRHAIEVGIRMTLGFEWILKGRDNETKDNIPSSKNELDLANRISYHCRINAEITGIDDAWIEKAWKLGPNSTSVENDISNLINCPSWNPEILKGGICPLSNPGTIYIVHLVLSTLCLHFLWYLLTLTLFITTTGKTVCAHVKSALSNIQNQDLDSSNLSSIFPFPLLEDVDSDTWIDLNSIDELEQKMSAMTGLDTSKNKNNKKDTSMDCKSGDDAEIEKMDSMMTGLEAFITNKSEIEGISTVQPETSIEPTKLTNQRFDPRNLSPKIFLSMFHSVLKARTPDEISIFPHNDADTQLLYHDKDLLKYFSPRDLNVDGDLEDDSDANTVEDDNDLPIHGQLDGDGASISEVMVSLSTYIIIFCKCTLLQVNSQNPNK